MIIGIVNNKGGVLKTTLATNLASSLYLDNKKVIIIDLDGQGNVSASFGKSPYNLKFTIMSFLKGECNLNDCIIKQKNNLHILPGNDDLNFFDYYVKSKEISQSNLKLTISKLNEIYDYVIIDTPPTMSTIVAIVLSINDVVVIPFEPDQYAVLGLRRVVDAAKEFMKKSNKKIKLVAVPTKVNVRAIIHNEIINESIRPKLTNEDVYVTNSIISSSTKSTSSVGYEKVPIVFSVVKSKYQDEYKNLKNEIINYIYSNETDIKLISNIWKTKKENDINDLKSNLLKLENQFDILNKELDKTIINNSDANKKVDVEKINEISNNQVSNTNINLRLNYTPPISKKEEIEAKDNIDIDLKNNLNNNQSNESNEVIISSEIKNIDEQKNKLFHDKWRESIKNNEQKEKNNYSSLFEDKSKSKNEKNIFYGNVVDFKKYLNNK